MDAFRDLFFGLLENLRYDCLKDAWRRFVVGLHMESAGTTPVRQHSQE